MAAVLLATARWVDPIATLDTGISGDSGTDGFITAAGAQDGNDDTRQTMRVLDATLPGVSGALQSVITAALDAAVLDSVTFVRVRARARCEVTGPGPAECLLAFVLNGSETPIADLSATPLPTDLELMLTLNPETAAPWQPGDLEGDQIGVKFAAANLDPTFLTASQPMLSEFAVEIWGETDLEGVAVALGSDVLLEQSSAEATETETLGDAVNLEASVGALIETETLGDSSEMATSREEVNTNEQFGEDVDRISSNAIVEE